MWVEVWFYGNLLKKKVFFLVGFFGVGKMIIVYVLVNEYGFEVIEFNVSDERMYEKIECYV